ncbi:MAG: DUF1062 domain-containing protein [Rhizobiaceae bacterium]|nr:DUF1062 domain-containing protein [Rhizobiaceae bacterium]
MSDTLCVRWTITANEYPQPLLYCRRCCSTRPYRTGGKVRVNANGKRIDAWLIYRCTSCDGTWKRPLLERLLVGSIEPEFLSRLMANDAELVAHFASDAEDLRRHAQKLKEVARIRVTKSVLSGDASLPQVLCIGFAVPHPVSLRLDRLLAEELGLSRSRIDRLAREGLLRVAGSNTARALRRSVRDGIQVKVGLSGRESTEVANRASGHMA